MLYFCLFLLITPNSLLISDECMGSYASGRENNNKTLHKMSEKEYSTLRIEIGNFILFITCHEIASPFSLKINLNKICINCMHKVKNEYHNKIQ